MKYREHFKQHYQRWLKGFTDSNLILQEQALGNLIDGNQIEHCLLIDEVILLYELVRDEIVYRFGEVIGLLTDAE